MIRLELSIAGALLLLCAASPATADEPVGAREPHLMSETAEVTSVVDAFDGDDPFDLNLVLGFTNRGSTPRSAARRRSPTRWASPKEASSRPPRTSLATRRPARRCSS